MELDSLLEDIYDCPLPGQNILEPWENWVVDDCREALKVPDSCEDVIECSSSSSFGDTVAAAASFGEPEVESRMFAYPPQLSSPPNRSYSTFHQVQNQILQENVTGHVTGFNDVSDQRQQRPFILIKKMDMEK
ncbi:hypothetical protein RYX36_011568 [Vicia faba]